VALITEYYSIYFLILKECYLIHFLFYHKNIIKKIDDRLSSRNNYNTSLKKYNEVYEK